MGVKNTTHENLEQLGLFENYIECEPYINREAVLQKYNNCIKWFMETDNIYMMEQEELEQLKNYINNYYKYLGKKIYKWNIEGELERLKNAKDIGTTLLYFYKKNQDEYYKEMSENFLKIVEDNYEDLLKNAANYKDCKITEKKSKEYIEQIELELK